MNLIFAYHARLHRCAAVLAIALVVALNLLAVMPAAHAWLRQREAEPATPRCSHHGCTSDAPAPAEDDCAVVKFAHGHGGYAFGSVQAEPASRNFVSVLAPHRDSFAPSPASRLPPGCGPPAV